MTSQYRDRLQIYISTFANIRRKTGRKVQLMAKSLNICESGLSQGSMIHATVPSFWEYRIVGCASGQKGNDQNK